MQIYTVYSISKNGQIADLEFVPEKFNWKAFFFNFIWLLYNRAWSQLFSYTLLIMALSQLLSLDVISQTTTDIVLICSFTFLGFAAEDIRRGKLESSGYELADILVASTPEEAEYRFINKLTTQNATSVTDDPKPTSI